MVRGVGENDWAVPRNDSEPLVLNGPLKASAGLIDDTKKYSGGSAFVGVGAVGLGRRRAGAARGEPGGPQRRAGVQLRRAQLRRRGVRHGRLVPAGLRLAR